jgi:type IV secretory pathway TrbD component
MMTKVPRLQPVYVSINKPLTIGGADRRLFFMALVVGGATFTLFGSLLAGLLMFLALYLGTRWVTQRDPQLWRIVLRSARVRPSYDPGKFAYLTVQRKRKDRP